jgi:hypothetical protein
MEKKRIRGENVGFNTDGAFFAAMNMLNKQLEFRYIPHHYMNINDIPIHFVGEINQKFIETIIEGDVETNKFIIWYV